MGTRKTFFLPSPYFIFSPCVSCFVGFFSLGFLFVCFLLFKEQLFKASDAKKLFLQKASCIQRERVSHNSVALSLMLHQFFHQTKEVPKLLRRERGVKAAQPEP